MVTFDSEIRSLIRASGNASNWKHLLHVMETTSAERKTNAGPIFHDLAERFKKRGVVVIFSDLFDNVASLMAGLRHLRHRRHDVLLFHVLDSAELDFPFQQPTLFRGLEGLPEVSVDPRALRQAYLRELHQFLHQIKSGCRDQGIEYVLMRTDQSLDVTLSPILSRRMANSS
jgi:uncharacterized protein (DUF58 family)